MTCPVVAAELREQGLGNKEAEKEETVLLETNTKRAAQGDHQYSAGKDKIARCASPPKTPHTHQAHDLRPVADTGGRAAATNTPKDGVGVPPAAQVSAVEDAVQVEPVEDAAQVESVEDAAQVEPVEDATQVGAAEDAVQEAAAEDAAQENEADAQGVLMSPSVQKSAHHTLVDSKCNVMGYDQIASAMARCQVMSS